MHISLIYIYIYFVTSFLKLKELIVGFVNKVFYIIYLFIITRQPKVSFKVPFNKSVVIKIKKYI